MTEPTPRVDPASVDAAFAAARASAEAGQSRAARILLDELRPRTAAEALLCAEVLQATGWFRRGHALLRWANKRFDDDAIRVALARLDLAQGLLPERRTRNLLERAQGASAAALRARVDASAHKTIPAPAGDDSDVDVALLLFASDAPRAVQLAQAVVTRSPTQARARLVAAALLRANGQIEEGRALLKDGARAAEDARVELAHALALVADGKLEEAGLATARLRGRFPGLAADRSLRLLLTTLAWGAGRNEDAATFLTGASSLSAAEQAAAVFLAGGPPAAAPATMTGPAGATAPVGGAAGGKPTRPKKAATGFVAVDADAPAPAAWRRPAAALALVVGVGYALARLLSPGEDPPPVAAIVDAGAAIAEPPAEPPPRVDAATFSARAAACGVTVAPVVDVGVSRARAAAALEGRLFDGRAASLGRFPLALDETLTGRPGAAALGLGTGGRAEPALVIAGGSVIGWALLPTNDDARPALQDLPQISLARVPFVAPSPAACPAGHIGSCWRSQAGCDGVVVGVRAICAGGLPVTRGADLAPCRLDAVVVVDAVGAAPIVAAPFDAGTALSDGGPPPEGGGGPVGDAGSAPAPPTAPPTTTAAPPTTAPDAGSPAATADAGL